MLLYLVAAILSPHRGQFLDYLVRNLAAKYRQEICDRIHRLYKLNEPFEQPPMTFLLSYLQIDPASSCDLIQATNKLLSIESSASPLSSTIGNRVHINRSARFGGQEYFRDHERSKLKKELAEVARSRAFWKTRAERYHKDHESLKAELSEVKDNLQKLVFEVEKRTYMLEQVANAYGNLYVEWQGLGKKVESLEKFVVENGLKHKQELCKESD